MGSVFRIHIRIDLALIDQEPGAMNSAKMSLILIFPKKFLTYINIAKNLTHLLFNFAYLLYREKIKKL
jgi:hypothetical protein